MTDYADKDPEDTYDAGDPINVRLDVLTRAVTALRASNDSRRRARADDLLRVIARFRNEMSEAQVWLDELRERLREI